MPLSVPQRTKPIQSLTAQNLVVYSPSHPAVIFGKIKSGAIRHWNQNRMVRSVHRWLRPPPRTKKIQPAAPEGSKPSGLILPQQGKSFMLIQSSDLMSDLLAENCRLRNMVDILVRQDRGDQFIYPR